MTLQKTEVQKPFSMILMSQKEKLLQSSISNVDFTFFQKTKYAVPGAGAFSKQISQMTDIYRIENSTFPKKI